MGIGKIPLIGSVDTDVTPVKKKEEFPAVPFFPSKTNYSNWVFCSKINVVKINNPELKYLFTHFDH